MIARVGDLALALGDDLESLEINRGYGLSGMMSRHLAAHGLTGAPSQYALIDNARRARLKQSREEYAAAMGALFAPFTRVAAASPHAAAPVERSAAELVTPTATNRPIADPYTRYIVAREKVNQGAAVVLMSVAAARSLAPATTTPCTPSPRPSSGPRSAPGSYGLVGANGGIMSKYSVGVYSTTPAAWTPDRSADRQAEIDGWAAPEQARYADGPATIETYTVKHARDGARTGIIIGRLDSSQSRYVAKGDDPDLLDLLTAAKEPIGQPVYARSFGFGNRVATTRARMDELFPPQPPALP